MHALPVFHGHPNRWHADYREYTAAAGEEKPAAAALQTGSADRETTAIGFGADLAHSKFIL